MGTESIMQRLEQIEPKIVFFESSVHYNGKLRSLTEKYEQCLGRLRKVADFKRAVLIIRDEPYSKEQPDSTTWGRFLSTAKGRPLTFEQLPFSHPGFIVYSSGTTGAPKCIVHSACGLLMQVKKDYLLHLDVRPGDTVYQYTTTGWIMWAMVLCGLSYGGSVVVYDGSPLYPDPLVTLRLVEKLKDGKTKYQKAYFERFGNNIWTQGDFISASPVSGGFTILGRRSVFQEGGKPFPSSTSPGSNGSLVHILTEEIQSSDGVLNPSGVRFGSAEIYQAIKKFTEFEETICIGQRRPQDNDKAVILFVKMKGSQHLTKALIVSVRSAISTSLSPRHVPKFIFDVPEIPYTINGKKIELAVKQIVSSQVITPSGAVMNPESLKFFQRFAHDSYLKQKVEEPKNQL
ncbi:hypothetical protein Z517_10051 [Fonsecaea pedrosoi CBS 271.37]|uniref:AMP-dependent synthetase/ligase domain-containing protein n=1 Tax=Fonsecaea pedrosoi CBS 271.37 TaxID=1442368 RepID=A0A0D2GGA3_9EURO|nr:uncharacterized protein Z517_10051 [Fonsecaea pedrosoi CBS 271.37]KIW77605.1 hypothetical protein Z517_10051 [Fonsecaea pedrosoi CBS 271.37]